MEQLAALNPMFERPSTITSSLRYSKREIAVDRGGQTAFHELKKHS